MYSKWGIPLKLLLKWAAGRKHYLRLNAVTSVQAAMQAHLDTAPVVLGDSTDPLLSPSREPDLGRSEGEGEAQGDTGPEPTPSQSSVASIAAPPLRVYLNSHVLWARCNGKSLLGRWSQARVSVKQRVMSLVDVHMPTLCMPISQPSLQKR